MEESSICNILQSRKYAIKISLLKILGEKLLAFNDATIMKRQLRYRFVLKYFIALLEQQI